MVLYIVDLDYYVYKISTLFSQHDGFLTYPIIITEKQKKQIN